VRQTDIEHLFGAISSEQDIASRISRYEFFLFIVIFASAFDVADGFSLPFLSVRDSDIILAAALFSFATLNVISFLFELDVELKKSISKSLLEQRVDLDPSGMTRLLNLSKPNLLAPWTEKMKSKDMLAGARFALPILILIPIALFLITLAAIVIIVPISSAHGLFVRSENSIEYLALLVVSSVAILLRIFATPLFKSFTVGIEDYAAIKNFNSNVDRYGIRGALFILGDELSELLRDNELEKLAASRKRNNLPVARLHFRVKS
jgi:hypothetical protein